MLLSINIIPTPLLYIFDVGKKIPQDPKLWKDEFNGDTENLWLNLSTGK